MTKTLRLLACVFVLAVCALPALAAEAPLPAFLDEAPAVVAPVCGGDAGVGPADILDGLMLRGERGGTPELGGCSNFCCTSNTQCTLRCGDAAACVGTGSCKRCIFL